jgi:23S rRNA (cytidine1920-2'-O)/16S rRNA (cytidine1409-2'-O)-methyltransferase
LLGGIASNYPAMKKERIDKLLFDRGMAESRSKARALIMSGVIVVDEKRVEKPSELFAADANIRIKGGSAESRYLSRGGLKLEKALAEFHICPDTYVCLDVGASTGGFTDCLLQHGASRVVAIDAGTNQLTWKLRSDPRVEVREKTNARHLKPEDFRERFNLIVVDVSFISVTKILPALVDLLRTDGKIIVLIKPQFEVGKGEVGKGGIVKDPEQHQKVVETINLFAEGLKLKWVGTIESPILGAEGNKEFLSLYEHQ